MLCGSPLLPLRFRPPVPAQICEAFGANRYPFPDDATRQRQMHAEVTSRLRELHSTLEASKQHRDSMLATVGYSLASWQQLARREKARPPYTLPARTIYPVLPSSVLSTGCIM